MVAMKLNAQIEAAPERVFALFTDIQKFQEHVTGIERVELLTDGDKTDKRGFCLGTQV